MNIVTSVVTQEKKREAQVKAAVRHESQLPRRTFKIKSVLKQDLGDALTILEYISINGRHL